MEKMADSIGVVLEQNQKEENLKKWEINSKNSIYNIGKRTFDIGVSLVGTALLLPVMAGVKIANIKNGDKEPILFKQERIGKDGKPIQIYKIRSMVPNAEQILEDLIKKDPR